MQTAFIVASSICALISPLIYAKSILNGVSKPHRTTRFVLLLITTLSTAALFAQGDTVAVWLAGISTLQAIVIFGLSIKYGMGGWAKLDIACLAIALIGIVAWQVTSEPILGLYFSILADFTGMVPAILKTYRLPHTENAWFFGLDVAAGIFTILAVTAFTPQAIAYPLYITLINSVMVFLILRPRPI